MRWKKICMLAKRAFPLLLVNVAAPSASSSSGPEARARNYPMVLLGGGMCKREGITQRSSFGMRIRELILKCGNLGIRGRYKGHGGLKHTDLVDFGAWAGTRRKLVSQSIDLGTHAQTACLLHLAVQHFFGPRHTRWRRRRERTEPAS